MKQTIRTAGMRPTLGALLGLLLAAGVVGELAAAEPTFGGSCDVTKLLGYCMEYRGADWQTPAAQADCATAPDGEFSTSPCPSASRAGTCSYLPRGTESSEIVYIFYQPMAASMAEMSCPGTFTPGQ